MLTLRPTEWGYYVTDMEGAGPLFRFVHSPGEDREIETAGTFQFVRPNGSTVTVPIGTRSDGASIPRLLWSVTGAPLDGDYREGAVIHDYLYRHGYTVGYSRREADDVFYEAMRASGVGAFRARKMWLAVRWGGGKAWHDGDGASTRGTKATTI